MTETFHTDIQTIFGGAVSRYLHKVSDLPANPSAIRVAFGKASPAERDQILAFIASNAPPIKGRRGAPRARIIAAYRYWRLTHYTNLDTGRKSLTAAVSAKKPGVDYLTMRKLVGLPPASSLGEIEQLLAKVTPAVGSVSLRPPKPDYTPPTKTGGRSLTVRRSASTPRRGKR